MKILWALILFKLLKEKFLFHQIIGIVSQKIKLKVNKKQKSKILKMIIIHRLFFGLLWQGEEVSIETVVKIRVERPSHYKKYKFLVIKQRESRTCPLF